MKNLFSLVDDLMCIPLGKWTIAWRENRVLHIWDIIRAGLLSTISDLVHVLVNGFLPGWSS